jgi:hypothetical protein
VVLSLLKNALSNVDLLTHLEFMVHVNHSVKTISLIGEDLGGELWFEKNERFWTNFFFGHSLQSDPFHHNTCRHRIQRTSSSPLRSSVYETWP